MKCASWSAHCSKILATAVHVSNVSSFGTNFTETHFMHKSSVRMVSTETNELAGELSNCYSPVIQHDRRHFINHQLIPACGGPPWNIHQSQLTSVPLWTAWTTPLLVYSPMTHSQKPCESYRRFLSMSAHVSGKTWCRCAAQFSQSLSMRHTLTCTRTRFGWLPATEKSEREALIHPCAWWSKVNAPHFWPQAPSCLKEKKFIWKLFHQTTYYIQLEFLTNTLAPNPSNSRKWIML